MLRSISHRSIDRIIFFTLLFLTVVILLMSPFESKATNQQYTNICANQSYIHRRLDSDVEDNLCEAYKDKVILIVNTASRCAFTDQYDDLEKLYARYKDQGLVVVGFPSNDFGNQEPGSEKQIKSFCRLTYGVKFPMYSKTIVTGNEAAAIYKSLKRASGNSPGWNFHKYLIGRNGDFISDFTSSTKPLSQKVTQAIEQVL
jgi:glutathione peroxidase